MEREGLREITWEENPNAPFSDFLPSVAHVLVSRIGRTGGGGREGRFPDQSVD